MAPSLAELMELIAAAHERNLGRLGVESSERFGEWNGRDLLVHFETWERWYAVRLQAVREGREPADDDLFGPEGKPAGSDDWGTDEINAWIEEQGRALSHREALERYRQTHEHLAALIASLSDEELRARSGVGSGHALWYELGWESYLHTDTHLGPSSPERTGPIPGQS